MGALLSCSVDFSGYTGGVLLFVTFVAFPPVRCGQCWRNVAVVIGGFRFFCE